jgi:hypothetical protein
MCSWCIRVRGNTDISYFVVKRDRRDVIVSVLEEGIQCIDFMNNKPMFVLWFLLQHFFSSLLSLMHFYLIMKHLNFRIQRLKMTVVYSQLQSVILPTRLHDKPRTSSPDVFYKMVQQSHYRFLHLFSVSSILDYFIYILDAWQRDIYFIETTK